MDLGDMQPKKRPLSITSLLPGEFPEQELDMYMHWEDKASKRELIFLKKCFWFFFTLKFYLVLWDSLQEDNINIPHKDNTFNVSFAWFDYPCELQDAKINCGPQLKQEWQEHWCLINAIWNRLRCQGWGTSALGLCENCGGWGGDWLTASLHNKKLSEAVKCQQCIRKESAP